MGMTWATIPITKCCSNRASNWINHITRLIALTVKYHSSFQPQMLGIALLWTVITHASHPLIGEDKNQGLDCWVRLQTPKQVIYPNLFLVTSSLKLCVMGLPGGFFNLFQRNETLRTRNHMQGGKIINKFALWMGQIFKLLVRSWFFST